MSKILFEYDPSRGLRIDYEETGDGQIVLHYTQDVEPVLDINAAKRSAGRDYYAADTDMWKVASIPIVVQYEWVRRYGITDVTLPEYQPLLAKLLNDPEWRYLKTAEVII
jgi:hypothetical protein